MVKPGATPIGVAKHPEALGWFGKPKGKLASTWPILRHTHPLHHDWGLRLKGLKHWVFAIQGDHLFELKDQTWLPQGRK